MSEPLAAWPPPNPYVGPLPFKVGEKFYGREMEIQKLFRVLTAEELVLLYAPSGAGKTSIIQAGLIPKLKADNYRPLPIIRVGRPVPPEMQDKAVNRFVLSALLSLEQGLKEEGLPDSELTDPEKLAGMTLAQYLQQRPTIGAESDREVLVFDQFEELFTMDAAIAASQKMREEFFSQIGVAIKGRWALFAIRKDYKAELDARLRYNDFLPLDFLGKAAAQKALQCPAEASGVHFTDEAAEKLVENLSQIRRPLLDKTIAEQPGAYVEPVFLQVVCLGLWDKLITRSAVKKAEIGLGDIDDLGDVNTALSHYYDEQLAAAAEAGGVRERIIRDWFESALLLGRGVRTQVLAGSLDEYGLNDTTVKCLEKAYLIRRDDVRNTDWLELSHDRLVEPIRDSNACWRKSHSSILQLQTELWENKGRPNGLWLRNEELVEAEEWARQHSDQLEENEEEFLSLSREFENRVRREQVAEIEAKRLEEAQKAEALRLEEAQKAEALRLEETQKAEALRLEEAQKAEALRQAEARLAEKKIRKGLMFSATVLAVLLAYTAILWLRAEKYAGEAQKQATKARSYSIAAKSVTLTGNLTDVSLLLSQQAVNIDNNDDTRQNLIDCLGRNPYLSMYFRGHERTVYSVAFSPDSKILVSASLDKTLRLWDVASGAPIANPLTAHTDCVNYVTFNPKRGAMFASASDDKSILLWNIGVSQNATITAKIGLPPASASNPGDPTRPILGHTHQVFGIGFSPNGNMLASCGRDNRILLWNVTDPYKIGLSLNPRNSMQLPGEVYRVVFRDDRTLAASCSDHKVYLYDVSNPANPKRLSVLTGHSQKVFGIAFSPDGKTLASGSADSTIRLWDVSMAKIPPTLHALKELKGHSGFVWSVAFSPDGKILASASRDQTILLWDVSLSGQAQVVGQPLLGHRNDVLAVAFSPDRQTLASGSGDTTAIRWDVSHLRPLPGSDQMKTIAYCPQAGSHVLVTGGKEIVFWNGKTHERLGKALVYPQLGSAVTLCFTNDGKILASGHEDGTIILWNVASQTCRGLLLGHTRDVNSVVFNPEGTLLASGSRDRTIRLWDVKSGAEIYDKRIGDPTDSSPKRKVGSYEFSMDNIYRLAFSPDGKTLAWGANDKQILLWDVPSWQPVGVLKGSGDAVYCVAFSSDKEHPILASSSQDQKIFLWDVAARKMIGSPFGTQTGTVRSLAFSSDGGTLASGSDDRTVVLWDTRELAKPKPLAYRLTEHTNGIIGLAFSQDGHTIASCSNSSSVILWDIEWERRKYASWQTQVCSTVQRNLSPTEWSNYNPDMSYQKTCPNLPVPSN